MVCWVLSQSWELGTCARELASTEVATWIGAVRVLPIARKLVEAKSITGEVVKPTTHAGSGESSSGKSLSYSSVSAWISTNAILSSRESTIAWLIGSGV